MAWRNGDSFRGGVRSGCGALGVHGEGSPNPSAAARCGTASDALTCLRLRLSSVAFRDNSSRLRWQTLPRPPLRRLDRRNRFIGVVADRVFRNRFALADLRCTEDGELVAIHDDRSAILPAGEHIPPISSLAAP